MASPKQFDYRKLISTKERKADWYSDHLQAGFDTVNRMAALYGDIPFEELFNRPLAMVIPRLQANLCQARPGLFKYASEVQDQLDTLLATGANRTFFDLVHSKRGQYPEELEEALHTLMLRHGIHFPLPNHYRPKNYHRAIQDLVTYAGHRTYREVFACQCKWSHNERSAVWYALRDRIIFLSGNGLCCSGGSCIPGTQSCFKGLGGTGCATGSSGCTAPPRPKPKPRPVV